MKIKDHFSGHASLYANTRPDYPEELFRTLAAMSPGKSCAWDCATGNGQAARPLTEYFDAVYATDASQQQIGQSRKFDRVYYHVATAEASAIAAETIDLVVVAQALHWFNISAFVDEVRRVLKKDGILATWCYPWVRVCPEVDEVVSFFHGHTVGPYWPAERRHVESGYSTLDLPLLEQPVPQFAIEKLWDLARFGQYLESWSATQRYVRECGRDAIDELIGNLREVWRPAEEKRRVYWPLVVRAGRLA